MKTFALFRFKNQIAREVFTVVFEAMRKRKNRA